MTTSHAYFSIAEVACKCGCGKANISRTLLAKLNELRRRLNRPVILNSCVRCEKHNKAIGGKPNSAHLHGWAADVRVDSALEKFEVLEALFDMGIKRIGVYKNFIHFDVAPRFVAGQPGLLYPQKVVW
jgi:uncharacterized protein YcbK (DUF882 family)